MSKFGQNGAYILGGCSFGKSGQTDRWTDIKCFGGYNIIPRHFFVVGYKKKIKLDYVENVNLLDQYITWNNMHIEKHDKTAKNVYQM